MARSVPCAGGDHKVKCKICQAKSSYQKILCGNTGAGRTIRQTRHLPGAPGPIEGFWGPQNAPMHIFCPHIYYFYKNLFTIVASGCLIITHVLTIFPCAPPFSLHYMDYSMLRASRSSCVCGNYVKFKTVSGKREREKSSET